MRDAVAKGMPVLMAWDAQTKQLSFRLWCAWVAFHAALLSVIALHFWPVEVATWTTIGFYVVTMVFYMLKTLTKAKIDLDDKSIELEDSTANEGPNLDVQKPKKDEE